MRISLIITVLLNACSFVKAEVFFNYSLLGMEEEEKEKGKRKRKKDDQSDDGRISVRFVGEIDPRDYFGLWNEDNDKHKE